MSTKKKLTALGIALGILATFTAGVSVGASGTLKEIKAHLDQGKTFELNGDTWTPESQNVVLHPIVYQGTTYLPLRSLAEALDIPVEYVAAKQKIKIGVDPRIPIANLDGVQTSSNITITKDKAFTAVSGEDLGISFIIDGVSTNKEEPSEISFDLDKKYSRLELVITVLDADTEMSVVARNDKWVYFGSEFGKGMSRMVYNRADIIDDLRLEFYSEAEPGKEGKPERIVVSGTVKHL